MKPCTKCGKPGVVCIPKRNKQGFFVVKDENNTRCNDCLNKALKVVCIALAKE